MSSTRRPARRNGEQDVTGQNDVPSLSSRSALFILVFKHCCFLRIKKLYLACFDDDCFQNMALYALMFRFLTFSVELGSRRPCLEGNSHVMTLLSLFTRRRLLLLNMVGSPHALAFIHTSLYPSPDVDSMDHLGQRPCDDYPSSASECEEKEHPSLTDEQKRNFRLGHSPVCCSLRLGTFCVRCSFRRHRRVRALSPPRLRSDHLHAVWPRLPPRHLPSPSTMTKMKTRQPC